MLRSSSLGIVLVSGVMVVSGSRQPDRASPEEGYQYARLEVPARGARRKPRSGPACRCALARSTRQRMALHVSPAGSRYPAGAGRTPRAQNLLESNLEGCRKYARAEIRRRVLLAKLSLRRGRPDSGGLRSLLEEARAMAGATALQGFVPKSMSFAASCNFFGTISIRRNEPGGWRSRLPKMPAMNIRMPPPPITWA